MEKRLVVGSDSLVRLSNGNSVNYINFDNAATTPPFKSVIDEITSFSCNYSSIHRGTGYKSIISSRLYDEGREIVLDFVGGNRDYHTVIFLKNTTECINKLSYRLQDTLKDKVVLSTYMEHHSNLLPWKYRYNTDYVEVDSSGRLCLEDLEFKLKLYGGKVGLVAVTGASNVTGYINPIYEIAKICHKYGAKILVDGAQLIPHSPFKMGDINDPEHIDFIAFSGHKMYAPFGTGALVAPKEIFKNGFSEQLGGGIVKYVSMEDVVWLDPPMKEEAGTPNVMGVVALSTSIKMLQDLDMRKIEEYERSLTRYAIDLIQNIPGIILYDDKNVDEKVSIISFNMEGLHHNELALILAREGGIAVRNGCFCAQPYVQRLLKISKEEMMRYRSDENLPDPGLVRISFGLYNDYDEIYLLSYLLNEISRNINYYKNKYINSPFY
ncbi:aminotransferase class V-fold PLP-dependent enzyme [Tissierella sp. MB52-C2]|uniref:aminotransferase class V-fold PLP-dependent enzyme n=1 Tax=Tissierella sp. MB52-C2 TaxID=3070999 RepID=UPI00280BC209|nr:aminotransferase class V-fold PLP-dependent enzyme [Tissierella sp. MB52-C2]WMM25140.1 aminotransferase class V-fold PLP-dependent enzyme [Tissierella sp. MB52-C2]